jgi:hypothetical protein
MSIKQMTFLDYDGFVEKFETRKTTDDCYTPPNIYDAVKAWAVKEYALEGRESVRPFWPGGDYEAFDYPDNCVVIDNPPFSILSKICKWYAAQGIDFFLFAPYLTNFGLPANHIIAPCSITYENGAKVDTAFVTSLGEWFIRTAPDLMDAIQSEEDANRGAKTKALPKYEYPDAILTSAKAGYFCKHHTPFALKREDCAFIRKLDAQGGAAIFGGGYLLSERAAAERAAAIRWKLSPREIALQSLLGKGVTP